MLDIGSIAVGCNLFGRSKIHREVMYGETSLEVLYVAPGSRGRVEGNPKLELSSDMIGYALGIYVALL